MVIAGNDGFLGPAPVYMVLPSAGSSGGDSPQRQSEAIAAGQLPSKGSMTASLMTSAVEHGAQFRRNFMISG